MGQRGPKPSCLCGRCPKCRSRERMRRRYHGLPPLPSLTEEISEAAIDNATVALERRAEGESWEYIASTLGYANSRSLKQLCVKTYGDDLMTEAELVNGRRHTKGGQTRTYHSWRGMKDRCLNPNNQRWDRYGGRGIQVSSRWLGPDGFANFLADMGERPEGRTLDRIRVNGNYEPGNCRWATPKEQRANQGCRSCDDLRSLVLLLTIALARGGYRPRAEVI